MGFRDAVSAVPAKPLIAIALVLTAGAAAWHGWTLHGVCTERTALTRSLKDWAANLLAGKPQKARLDAATGFDWDEVRIANAVHSAGTVTDCPYGWHWSMERDAMAQAGHLTLLGFFKGGRMVEMGDFDSRWARFDVSGDPIPRAGAIFTAGTSDHTLQLTRDE